MVFSCVQAPREDRLRAFKLEWQTVSHGVTCSGVCYRCSEAMDRQTLAVTSWRGHVVSASSLVLASPCPPAPSAVPPPDPSRACPRAFSRASRTSGRSRNHGRRPHAASIDRCTKCRPVRLGVRCSRSHSGTCEYPTLQITNPPKRVCCPSVALMLMSSCACGAWLQVRRGRGQEGRGKQARGLALG